jgi:hypothetical protein
MVSSRYSEKHALRMPSGFELARASHLTHVARRDRLVLPAPQLHVRHSVRVECLIDLKKWKRIVVVVRFDYLNRETCNTCVHLQHQRCESVGDFAL